MRNKHPGPCYHCSKTVEVGQGHFERHNGGWRVIHAKCVYELRGWANREAHIGRKKEVKK